MGLQFKNVQLESKLLDRVMCDRCLQDIEKESEGGWNQFGEPQSVFHPPAFREFFLLRQTWGYSSRKDGEAHEAVLCEGCYDAVFKDVRIKVTTRE
jgi:hypothetical protein